MKTLLANGATLIVSARKFTRRDSTDPGFRPWPFTQSFDFFGNDPYQVQFAWLLKDGTPVAYVYAPAESYGQINDRLLSLQQYIQFRDTGLYGGELFNSLIRPNLVSKII